MQPGNLSTLSDQRGKAPFLTNDRSALLVSGQLLASLRNEAIRYNGDDSRSRGAYGDNTWQAEIQGQAEIAQGTRKWLAHHWQRTPRSGWLRSLRQPRRSRSSLLACCLLSFWGLVTLASGAVLVLVYVRGDEHLYALIWRLVGEFFVSMMGAHRTQEQPAVNPTTTTTRLFASPSEGSSPGKSVSF